MWPTIYSSSSSDSLILLRTSAFAPCFPVTANSLTYALRSLRQALPASAPSSSIGEHFFLPTLWLTRHYPLLPRNFFGRGEPAVPETKDTFCIQITEIHHFPAFDSLTVSAPWWAHAMLKIQSVHLIETNKHIRVSKLGFHCFRWRCLVACPTAIHYLNNCWMFFDWTHMNLSQWNLKPMSTIFI